MTTRARRLRAGVVAAVALLALTACGGGESDQGPPSRGEGGRESTDGTTERSGATREGGEAAAEEGEETSAEPLASRPPEEVATLAMKAFQSVSSLRMTLLGDPEAVETGYIQVDRRGTCMGTATAPGEGSVEFFVREGEEVWMKPDTEFWQSDPEGVDPGFLSLVDGRYLYGRSGDPEMSEMAGECSLTAMWAEATLDAGPDDPEAVTELGPETEYNGVPVITVTGSDSRGAEVTMLVATEGEPYPVYVHSRENGREIEYELSQFNEPVEFEEPPADQVLDVADLRGGDLRA
ncbi:hypothetical protein ACTWP5_04790 [Streptomyces sp. 4N509B]|uniref:hypothetical protein n=1 Tax=Streptomyces sp. 4N509B TaxID=3457413 RepID=UPI003FD59C52